MFSFVLVVVPLVVKSLWLARPTGLDPKGSSRAPLAGTRLRRPGGALGSSAPWRPFVAGSLRWARGRRGGPVFRRFLEAGGRASGRVGEWASGS